MCPQEDKKISSFQDYRTRDSCHSSSHNTLHIFLQVMWSKKASYSSNNTRLLAAIDVDAIDIGADFDGDVMDCRTS